MKLKPTIFTFETVYRVLSIACVIVIMLYTFLIKQPVDFNVFYSAAKLAFTGENFYTVYGPQELPYWYFPWTAWFFIPFSFFSKDIALIIYLIVSLLCGYLSVSVLAKKMMPKANWLDKFFIFAMSLPFCWLLFLVGQMDFLLLVAATLMVYWIDSDRPIFAGSLMPILLFKPHIFLIFIPYACLKGGKRFVGGAIASVLLLTTIAFVLYPNWVTDMVSILQLSGQRTNDIFDFVTLPSLLGSTENYSGTANIPFTSVLILTGLIVIWLIRDTETFPLLSMALVASLFCAPRAYTYNFTILIPALIWLSAGLRKPFLLSLFWSVVAISSSLFKFSTGAYIIVLILLFAGIAKAIMSKKKSLPTVINKPA